ncbi:MAG: O-antigen ligase family protein [Janthinobacterium lividum]
MWQFFSEARVRQMSVFWCALIIGGLFAATWVRVLSSVGIAGLFLTGAGYSLEQRRVAQWAQWPSLLCFGLVYLVHLGTGLLRTSPTDPALWQDLLLESPFLLLPGAFLLLPAWRPGHLRFLWLLLLGCCLAAAAGSTGYYLRHQQLIEQLYLQSQVMPTVPDHIRFSLLVSMAVLAGLVLLTSARLPQPWRRLVLAGVVLLFLYQHLLAVRSGLVTLYGAGALWLAWLGGHYGRWRLMLRNALVALALGGSCLLLFPTLQNKIVNTRTDTAQLDTVESANNYSVTARYYSYQVADAVIREHPLLGVSKVQLDQAMAAQYGYMYPQISRAHYLLPHNQFIYNLAAYGVLGLLVSLLGFYYPLWRALRTRNALLVLIYAIVTASFLVEYTLETQIGVVTGLFFLLLAGAPTVAETSATQPGSYRPDARPAAIA